MFNNVIARVKLGCWMTNYESSEDITELFNAVLGKPWKSVTEYSHETRIVTEDNETIIFWTSNKYYAYANSGRVSNGVTEILWNGVMPETHTMMLMVNKVKQWKKPKLSSLIQ